MGEDMQLHSKSFITYEGVRASFLLGDAANTLRHLPDDVFNVAVTSPPYFWLRDYGFDGQLGQEGSVKEYIANLMEVFDEVKRTLHPEGVFFLNLGDTYYSGNGQPRGTDPRSSSRNFMRKKVRPVDQSGWDIPKKSLIGIPWKVAFAMQERGWTLRSSIIWNRGNAFPEPSARDRPHRQYENIFMFSKSRFYSFDRSKLAEEDVWNIPIVRNRKSKHNAYFPAALVQRCIEVASPVGGHVLDPFVGSGTTLFTAIENGRNAVGVDLGEEYFASATTALEQEGHQEICWHDMKSTFTGESVHWDSWPGNRLNFRKPSNGPAESLHPVCDHPELLTKDGRCFLCLELDGQISIFEEINHDKSI